MVSSTDPPDQRLTILPARRVVILGLEKDFDAVDVTTTDYDQMWVEWELIQDLCEGRDRMILKERRWLPREPKERPNNYNVRLFRSFLFGAFSDTIDKLSTKPFAREVVVRGDEDLPERLRPILEDVDLNGTDITQFAKKLLKDGIKYGHSLFLVDFPAIAQNTTDEPLSLGAELEMGLRPYWIHIRPPDLIGWKTDKLDNGETVLTQIRFRQTRVIPKGMFGDIPVDVIVVWTAPALTVEQIDSMTQAGIDVPDDARFGTVQEWVKKDTDDDFVPQPVRFHTFPGIPLVWLPINPTGFLTSKPPLQELAEQNLAHWQSSSDERNILRFVAIAILLLKGTRQAGDPDEDATGGPNDLVLAANNWIEGDENADGKYIEISGQGIGKLQEHIKKIEERMEQLGVEPLLARQADVTATAQRRDDKKVTSAIQGWVRALEKTLLWGTRVSATWIGEEIPEEFVYDVFNDFGLISGDTGDLTELRNTWMAGGISLKLYLIEAKKRGLIGEEVDIDAEIAAIEDELMRNQDRFDNSSNTENDQAAQAAEDEMETQLGQTA